MFSRRAAFRTAQRAQEQAMSAGMNTARRDVSGLGAFAAGTAAAAILSRRPILSAGLGAMSAIAAYTVFCRENQDSTVLAREPSERLRDARKNSGELKSRSTGSRDRQKPTMDDLQQTMEDARFVAREVFEELQVVGGEIVSAVADVAPEAKSRFDEEKKPIRVRSGKKGKEPDAWDVATAVPSAIAANAMVIGSIATDVAGDVKDRVLERLDASDEQVRAVDKNIKYAQRSVKRAVDAAQDTLSDAKKTIQEHDVGETAKIAAHKTARLASNAYDTAKEAAEETFDVDIPEADELVDVASRQARRAKRAAADTLGDAYDVAKDKASDALESIEEGAAKAVNKGARYAKRQAVRAKDIVADKAEDAYEAAKDKASDALESVEDGAGRYAGKGARYAKRQAIRAKDAAANKAEDAYEAAKDFVEEDEPISDKAARVYHKAGEYVPQIVKDAAVVGSAKVVQAKDAAVDKVYDKARDAKEAIVEKKDAAVDKAKEYMPDSAEDAAYSAKRKAIRTKDAAVDSARDARRAVERKAADAEDAAGDAMDSAKQKALRAKRAAKSKAREYADSMDEDDEGYLDSAKRWAAEKKDAAADTVREYMPDSARDAAYTAKRKAVRAKDAAMDKAREFMDEDYEDDDAAERQSRRPGRLAGDSQSFAQEARGDWWLPKEHRGLSNADLREQAERAAADEKDESSHKKGMLDSFRSALRGKRQEHRGDWETESGDSSNKDRSHQSGSWYSSNTAGEQQSGFSSSKERRMDKDNVPLTMRRGGIEALEERGGRAGLRMPMSPQVFDAAAHTHKRTQEEENDDLDDVRAHAPRTTSWWRRMEDDANFA